MSISCKTCKPHKRSVCGSNSKTYRNHCELHRDACLTGLKIQVAHDGHCQGMDTQYYNYSINILLLSVIWGIKLGKPYMFSVSIGFKVNMFRM